MKATRWSLICLLFLSLSEQLPAQVGNVLQVLAETGDAVSIGGGIRRDLLSGSSSGTAICGNTFYHNIEITNSTNGQFDFIADVSLSCNDSSLSATDCRFVGNSLEGRLNPRIPENIPVAIFANCTQLTSLSGGFTDAISLAIRGVIEQRNNVIQLSRPVTYVINGDNL